jgi:hypothetical protein
MFSTSQAAFALLAAGASASADTQHSVDCTVLGDLARLYTVSRLDEYVHGGEPAPVPRVIGYGNQQLCDATALSVTRGYSAAMARFGMPVLWSFDRPVGGCPVNDIALCHPLADPSAPPPDARAAVLASKVWYEVRDGVRAHMPWGTASDIAWFSGATLIESLAGSAPLDAAYGSIAIGDP